MLSAFKALCRYRCRHVTISPSPRTTFSAVVFEGLSEGAAILGTVLALFIQAWTLCPTLMHNHVVKILAQTTWSQQDATESLCLLCSGEDLGQKYLLRGAADYR